MVHFYPIITMRATCLNRKQLGISPATFIYNFRLNPGINIDYFPTQLLLNSINNRKVFHWRVEVEFLNI
jgi:hypothetical protein